MDTAGKFVLPGIVLVLTVIFGFWLSRTGKPYNGILFNVHKLIALGAVILIAAQSYNAYREIQAQALLIVCAIAAALCVAALFATGAFMSAEKFDHAVMLTIHRIALVPVLIALASAIYLFANMPA